MLTHVLKISSTPRSWQSPTFLRKAQSIFSQDTAVPIEVNEKHLANGRVGMGTSTFAGYHALYAVPIRHLMQMAEELPSTKRYSWFQWPCNVFF